jgi:hypothetical protein
MRPLHIVPATTRPRPAGGRRLVDRLQLQIGGKALRAELAADTARLHAPERSGGVERVVVNADATRLHALGDLLAALGIARPDAAAEPE